MVRGRRVVLATKLFPPDPTRTREGRGRIDRTVLPGGSSMSCPALCTDVWFNGLGGT